MLSEKILAKMGRRDLDEVESILREIQAQMARLKDDVTLSAYPHDAPEHNPIGQEEFWIAQREELLAALVKCGVVDGYKRMPGDTFRVVVSEDAVEDALRMFEQFKAQALPLPAVAPVAKRNVGRREVSRDVFVVHGHDEGAREAVARVLEKLRLNPVILHEKANRGRVLIEKLEAHADVAFGVVLLTPDDEGGKVGAKALSRRARQNVLLELGYFIGKLGRDKVCALHKADVELPSDIDGVLYVPMDDGGGWKLKLMAELKAAGLPVDANDLT